MSLTDKQVTALLAPLHPGRVRHVQGNAHLEAWDIRRHLIRVFGWGGWDFTVLSCDLVSERSLWDEKNPLKGRHTVVYRVIGRLTIKDPDGNVLAVFEDGATGDQANQPSLGDAHDGALKTAMSQALKRCAMNLGDRFGLSLYAKGNTEAVVVGSLAHQHDMPDTTKTDAVDSGELEDRPADRVKGDATEQTPWTEPVAQPPRVTDAKWLDAWRQVVVSAVSLDVLREQEERLKEQWTARRLTEADKNDAKALLDEQRIDLETAAQRAERDEAKAS